MQLINLIAHIVSSKKSDNPTNNLIMNLGTTEILLLVLLVLLLFGGKKIPELMKGLGKGVKSFKDGLNGKDDDTPAAES